ncbi:MAG: DNA-binding transcriptional regulator, MarR family [Myxococcaceae bacterium]|nr:DNA-binding transcriptional regulator, MarR family [Myxococcaceae bacterium]
MHAVTWDAKRVFLGLSKVRARLMERWGLTPARFDMLYAIRCQRQFWFPQRRLRELLGVCASTISRMIDSLVEIGFLVRRPIATDRRCRELKITKHGKRTLRCMFGNIIKTGLARLIVGHALADNPDAVATTDAEITKQIRDFSLTMAFLKLNLEDEAQFDYASAGERAQPGPTRICYLTDAERAIWLGDEEPLLAWVARL